MTSASQVLRPPPSRAPDQSTAMTACTSTLRFCGIDVGWPCIDKVLARATAQRPGRERPDCAWRARDHDAGADAAGCGLRQRAGPPRLLTPCRRYALIPFGLALAGCEGGSR